ncbi:MAG: hypothetical protein LUD14_00830 [Clostridiales bacterium]|nr:hypothetical protein [Clostridiales bacterium]
MGLFGKKEVCPVCGKKVKGDVLIRIKDNISLCQACSARVNMDVALLPQQTAEDIRRHLEYRDQNQEKVDSFENTWSERVGVFTVCMDGNKKMWYCTKNKKDKNPPILSYDEVVSAVYLEDDEPAEEEEKKGVFGSLFGGKKEAKTLHSMKIHVELSNPYTRTLELEAVPVNGEVRTGSMSYKSNRKALDKVMEMMNTILRDREQAEPAPACELQQGDSAEAGSASEE